MSLNPKAFQKELTKKIIKDTPISSNKMELKSKPFLVLDQNKVDKKVKKYFFLTNLSTIFRKINILQIFHF